MPIFSARIKSQAASNPGVGPEESGPSALSGREGLLQAIEDVLGPPGEPVDLPRSSADLRFLRHHEPRLLQFGEVLEHGGRGEPKSLLEPVAVGVATGPANLKDDPEFGRDEEVRHGEVRRDLSLKPIVRRLRYILKSGATPLLMGQTQKGLGLVLAFLLLTASLPTVVGQSPSAPLMLSLSVSLSPTSLTLNKGGTGQASLVIRNTGDGILSLSGVGVLIGGGVDAGLYGSCTAPIIYGVKLEPGASRTVQVQFTASSRTGSYECLVSVGSSCGDTAERCQTATFSGDYAYNWRISVSVTNSPPPVPTVDGRPSARVGDSGSYSISFNNPDVGEKVTCSVDWGDGTQAETQSATSCPPLSHTWNIAGTFSVRAKVKDEEGLESSWSSPFTVTVVAAQQSPTQTPSPGPTTPPPTLPTIAPQPSPAPTVVAGATKYVCPDRTTVDDPARCPKPSPASQECRLSASAQADRAIIEYSGGPDCKPQICDFKVAGTTIRAGVKLYVGTKIEIPKTEIPGGGAGTITLEPVCAVEGATPAATAKPRATPGFEVLFAILAIGLALLNRRWT